MRQTTYNININGPSQHQRGGPWQGSRWGVGAGNGRPNRGGFQLRTMAVRKLGGGQSGVIFVRLQRVAPWRRRPAPSWAVQAAWWPPFGAARGPCGSWRQKLWW